MSPAPVRLLWWKQNITSDLPPEYCCKVYGHHEYYKRYAMLSCYTTKELIFYKELIKQRIELLEIYAKREEKRYKELNLI